MNAAMAALELPLDDDGELAEPLAAILSDGLIERGDCIVLARFGGPPGQPPNLRRPVSDETGFEALHNHLHIEDELPPLQATPAETLRQAARYVSSLAALLEAEYPQRRFRIIVGVGDSCVVRFHTDRPDSPWLADDIEGYEHEAVLDVVTGAD
jgi:hypothetical protein